jgi:hypothetical protein
VAAAVVAAAVVAARWYANRADELGRRRDFPLVSVVLLAVLAAGAAPPGVLWARQERRLAAVASALAAYVRSGGRRPSRAQVVAVHVPAHEAMHMAGLVQEHAAECAAVQRDARAARLLGASPDDARALGGGVLADRLPGDARRLPVHRLPAGRHPRRAPA